jgi:hypothetical protein
VPFRLGPAVGGGGARGRAKGEGEAIRDHFGASNINKQRKSQGKSNKFY